MKTLKEPKQDRVRILVRQLLQTQAKKPLFLQFAPQRPVLRGSIGTTVGLTKAAHLASFDWLRLALACEIVFFIGVCLWWMHKAPIPQQVMLAWNADEVSHLKVIEYMRNNHAFPPYEGLYYESIHPPLYHALAALSHLSPMGLRFMNTLLGLGVLGFAVGCAKRLNVSPVLVVGLLVTAPIFFTECAAVTNDILAMFFCSWSLYLILSKGNVTTLAVVLALGALTKYQCLVMIPVAFLALRDWKSCALILGTVAVVSGWWYGRNWLLFGDPLRQHAEAVLLARLKGYDGDPLSYWGTIAVRAVTSIPTNARMAAGSVSVMAFACATVLVVGLLRSLKLERWLLWLPVCLDVLLYLSYNRAHQMGNLRLLLPLMLPAVLLAAQGWTSRKARAPKIPNMPAPSLRP